MKSIISFFFILAFLFTGVWNAQAQEKANTIDTLTFKVEGVCKMCKERIENAALIKGVKLAEWDRETHLLKVIYRADKVREIAIHKAVAAHGHDTDKVKATKKAYEKLPACCAYRDGVKDH